MSSILKKFNHLPSLVLKPSSLIRTTQVSKSGSQCKFITNISYTSRQWISCVDDFGRPDIKKTDIKPVYPINNKFGNRNVNMNDHIIIDVTNDYIGDESNEYEYSEEYSNIYSAISENKIRMLTSYEANPGRSKPLFKITNKHFINGNPMLSPFPRYLKTALFGMGCFWSSENVFMNLSGIYSTQVGYLGGYTKNPTYEEVCNNETGHIEVVRIIYDPQIIKYNQLLKLFWEKHNPCQGMRQGNNWGTQYRSAVFYFGDTQKHKALRSKLEYEEAIQFHYKNARITTEIIDGENYPFYYAEDYHQQYFGKNPDKIGRCSMKGLSVTGRLPPLTNAQDMLKQKHYN